MVDGFGPLGQADGVQVKVAVKNDGSTGERSGQSAGKAAQKHVLTCSTRKHNVDTLRRGTWRGADHPPVR